MGLAAQFMIEIGGLVKEVAEQVGSSAPYHFARCFMMIHGVPPSDVRRFRIKLAE
jgi:AraC family transcriptional regulator